MTEIDTAEQRKSAGVYENPIVLVGAIHRLCDEIDRLRAENDDLVSALREGLERAAAAMANAQAALETARAAALEEAMARFDQHVHPECMSVAYVCAELTRALASSGGEKGE